MSIENDPDGKWALRYMCTFCGAPYDSKEEASKCWNSHSELTVDFVWGGIGTGTDMPVECIIKKRERGFITEIATYELKDRQKVKMRVKESAKEKKS